MRVWLLLLLLLVAPGRVLAQDPTAETDSATPTADAESPEARVELRPQHTRDVTHVALSPDGSHAVTGSERTAIPWRLSETGLPLGLAAVRLAVGQGGDFAVANDGRLFATDDGGPRLAVFTPPLYDPAPPVSLHAPAKRLLLSNDGRRLLVAHADGSTSLLNSRTLLPLAVNDEQAQPTTCLAFGPGDATVAIADESGISIRSVPDLRETQRIGDIGNPPAHMAFTRDGRGLLVADRGGVSYIRLADAERYDYARQPVAPPLLDADIIDHSIGLAAGYGEVALFDLLTGEVLRRYEGFRGPVFEAAASRDGDFLLAGSSAGELIALGLDTATQTAVSGYLKPLNAVSFTPNGLYALTAGDDPDSRLWDMANAELFSTHEGHTDPVLDVAFNIDGLYAVSGGMDGALRRWKAGSGAILKTAALIEQPIGAVAYSPDGKLLGFGGGSLAYGGTGGGLARLHDAETGRLERNLPGHAGAVLDIVFSPDSSIVATGAADGLVRLFTTADGELLRTFEGHEGPVRAVAFSPDGRLVFSGGASETILVHDLLEGRLVARMWGHGGVVTDLDCDLDGRFLVSVGQDDALIRWDLATFRETGYIRTGSRGLAGVSLSPGGGYAVTAGEDGVMRLWNLAKLAEPGSAAQTAAFVGFISGDWAVLADGYYHGSEQAADFLALRDAGGLRPLEPAEAAVFARPEAIRAVMRGEKGEE